MLIRTFTVIRSALTLVILGTLIITAMLAQTPTAHAFSSSSGNTSPILDWNAPVIPAPAPAPTPQPAPQPELAPQPAPTPAPQISLEQSHPITIKTFTDGYRSCSWGYFDNNARIGYTAAHCFNGPIAGQKVYDDATGKAVGELITTYDYDFSTRLGTDIASVKLYDNVTGHNSYSGDRIAPESVLTDGMTICFSAKYTKNECGTLTMKRDSFNMDFSVEATRPAQSGDSGGAMYSPEHGFVGILNMTTKNSVYTMGHLIHPVLA